MNPEVLILGCGFLGRVLAAQWAAEGRRVWVTTRSPDRAAEFRALGWHPLVCDVLDPPALRHLPDVGVAVHCVGLDRAAGHPMRAVYVQGLGHVLDELTRPGRPTPRFLYVSSTGVYAQRDGSWVDEGSATEPEEESGRVVLAAEHLLRERLPQALVLRFAGLYGPGRLLRAAALRAGDPVPSDPQRWLNLIHVADGAAAVRAAAEKGTPGRIWNICDDRPVRRVDFYTRLAEVLGAPAPRFAPPAADSPAARADRTDRRISNRRMHEELGVVLRFPGYEEGLVASGN